MLQAPKSLQLVVPDYRDFCVVNDFSVVKYIIDFNGFTDFNDFGDFGYFMFSDFSDFGYFNDVSEFGDSNDFNDFGELNDFKKMKLFERGSDVSCQMNFIWSLARFPWRQI